MGLEGGRSLRKAKTRTVRKKRHEMYLIQPIVGVQTQEV